MHEYLHFGELDLIFKVKVCQRLSNFDQEWLLFTLPPGPMVGLKDLHTVHTALGQFRLEHGDLDLIFG